MREPGYKVVWPLGELVYQRLSLGPRVSDLKGKTMCELSDWIFRAEEVFPMIRGLLLGQYPSIKFIEYSAFGNTHGPTEAEVIAALPDRLHQHGCDAVISGVGG